MFADQASGSGRIEQSSLTTLARCLVACAAPAINWNGLETTRQLGEIGGARDHNVPIARFSVLVSGV
jgi:hypothetical protein